MPVSPDDLLRWSEQIAATARTGLGFSESLYERERYEEILKIAAQIRLASGFDGEGFGAKETDEHQLVELWRSQVGTGVSGYVTPKVSVAAVVLNEKLELLLIQRSDSGVWLYPTGWADVGYSPAEVVVKEVLEETGIEVVPERVLAVVDSMRTGFTAIPMYSIVFLCRVVGGELQPHPLETLDVGWFSFENLPSTMRSIVERVPYLSNLFDPTSAERPTFFDLPR
jgi:ADP-ribose pyrophosphatase YjhB (NUDIX family)